MQLDQKQVRRAFTRAASDYERNAVVQQEIGTRLIERLEGLRLEPETVVDLGAGTGLLSVALGKRFPAATVLALDRCPAMLRASRRHQGWFTWRFHPVTADAAALPLPTDAADLVFCNLVLPWCDEPAEVLNSIRRVLRPDGLLLLSVAGPDTLGELRQALDASGQAVIPGRFMDVQETGSALTAAGFAEPVLDTDWITTTHTSFRGLVGELKGAGLVNADPRRRRGLTAPGRLRALEAAYERFRTADGALPATWEIVYASAWGPPEGQPIRTGAGEEASFSIERLRRRND